MSDESDAAAVRSAVALGKTLMVSYDMWQKIFELSHAQAILSTSYVVAQVAREVGGKERAKQVVDAIREGALSELGLIP